MRLRKLGFAVLWVLPAVTAGLLWMRTYRFDDMWAFDAFGRSFLLQSNTHTCALRWTAAPFFVAQRRSDPVVGGPMRFWAWAWRPQTWGHHAYRLDGSCSEVYNILILNAGAKREYPCDTSSRVFRGVGIPYWSIIFINSVTVLLLYGRRSRRQIKKIRRGLCPACGYDLRATYDRCPECGWVRNNPEVRK
jgi:hypothetical protein